MLFGLSLRLVKRVSIVPTLFLSSNPFVYFIFLCMHILMFNDYPTIYQDHL